MNNQLKSLFEGDDFSKEFVDKVTAIFEAAVEEKTEQIKEETESKYEAISEEYAEYVVSEMEEKTDQYIKEELLPMVEKYLDYSVSEFMTENKPAIESSTKVELAEQFLTGLTGITEQFNVQVPEGKDDYITEMETKMRQMQDRFDALLDEKNAAEQEVIAFQKGQIIEAQIKDLTESQKEKFLKVADKVKFKDIDQFKDSISDLFESYFPVANGDVIKEELEQEVITEEIENDNSWAAQLFKRI